MSNTCLICGEESGAALDSEGCLRDAVSELDRLTRERRRIRHELRSWDERPWYSKAFDPITGVQTIQRRHRHDELVDRSMDLMGAILASNTDSHADAGGP